MTLTGGNGCGSGLHQLQGPNSCYVHGNALYVADSGNHRILKFSLESNRTIYGTVVAGGNGMGNATNQLYTPRAVILDDNDTLYIADGRKTVIILLKSSLLVL